MPLINLPVEEVDESVKRPIVVAVMTQLLHLIGLPDTIAMVFKGNASQPVYLNSTANYSDIDVTNRYDAETYLTLTDVEWEPNEFTLLNDVTYGDQPPIFLDDDLGVMLSPVYLSKKVSVSANITGSQTQVERWAAAIKRRTQNGLLNGIHAVNFHYPIPNKFMELLVDIHALRENVAPYGDKLGVWLREHFRETMTVLTKPNGEGVLYAIPETQAPIQGWFDFGISTPKPAKDSDGGRWSITFTYTFYADVPETMNMEYPYVIHNQLLPHRWILKPPPMAQLDFIKKEGSYSEQAMNKFRYAASSNEYTYNVRPGIPIPVFDDWRGERRVEGYGALIRAMIRVGENKKRVMNYRNMGEWELDPLLQKYMLTTNCVPNTWGDLVITHQLYRGNQLMDMNKLKLDDNLVLFYDDELNLRNRYHVVLSMMTDPRALTDKGKDLLTENGCFFKNWLETIYPGIADFMGWDLASCTIGSDGDTINRDEMEDAINEGSTGGVPGGGNPQRPGYDYNLVWPLIGKFTLISQKSK